MDKVPVRISDLGRKMRDNEAHHQPKKSKKTKRIVVSIAIVAAIAVVVLAGLFVYKNYIASPIDRGKYQAVFLTSGQVYFGKLNDLGGNYARLTDVFYIQANSTEDQQNPQNTTSDATDLQLIKLGNEVHGPEDEMLISRDQILFVENLKADGKVSDSIQQYKDQLN